MTIYVPFRYKEFTGFKICITILKMSVLIPMISKPIKKFKMQKLTAKVTKKKFF